MIWINKFVQLFLHIDIHLEVFIHKFGPVSYFILFGIIFCETGLIIVPLLPGDSLLFAAGALAAKGTLNLALLFGLLSMASIMGDNLNYWIGYFFGDTLVKQKSKWLNQRHIDKTHSFFAKYGAKVVLFARFIPIVRTCTPFVAGLGKMAYRQFLLFSVLGGLLWVGVGTVCGYLFGNIPFVKAHFGTVVIAIIFVSLLPVIIQFTKSMILARKG